jgi:hypothetical protein
MRSPERRFAVSGNAIGPETATEVPGGVRATADFGVQATWRNAFGGSMRSRLDFRAEFQYAGNAWAMTSCRLLGTPNLN